MFRSIFVALCIFPLESFGQPGIHLNKHADIADFPYQVSVQRSGRHVCSGALLHDSWIITAASCVYESGVPKLRVLLGSASLEDPPADAQFYNLSKIVVHRTFDKFLLTNNVALLKIKGRLGAGPSNLRPIFLPSLENYHLKDGSVLLVSGWKIRQHISAEQEENGFESQLSVTEAPLVNQRTCIRSMPSYKAVSGKMLCAGYIYPNTNETCQGDIGSPLVHNDVLMGILSSRDECSSADRPGIYTKISSFLPWITKIIALDSM